MEFSLRKQNFSASPTHCKFQALNIPGSCSCFLQLMMLDMSCCTTWLFIYLALWRWPCTAALLWQWLSLRSGTLIMYHVYGVQAHGHVIASRLIIIIIIIHNITTDFHPAVNVTKSSKEVPAKGAKKSASPVTRRSDINSISKLPPVFPSLLPISCLTIKKMKETNIKKKILLLQRPVCF